MIIIMSMTWIYQLMGYEKIKILMDNLWLKS